MSTWHFRIEDDLDTDVEVGRKFFTMCKYHDIPAMYDAEGTTVYSSEQLFKLVGHLTREAYTNYNLCYVKQFEEVHHVMPIGNDHGEFYFLSSLLRVIHKLYNLAVMAQNQNKIINVFYL